MVVEGFTDLEIYLKNSNHLKHSVCKYRAHPWFRSNKSWYSWGLVHWQENDDPVPAKIFMFLDFQNVTILRPEVGIGKGIYAVVQSAVSSSSQSRTEPHTLVGNLSDRLVMEDDLCLVDEIQSHSKGILWKLDKSKNP